VSDRFRLAICGAGKNTAAAHLPAALSSRELELVALVDTVPERAAALARDLGIRPRIAARLEAVLPEVEGVVISTPNDTHCALALECFAAGVSALIEKPLATSVEDGERIVRSAADHGVTAAVGYNTRFAAGVELMAECLRGETFGPVRRFAYQSGSTGKWSPVTGYTLDRAATGGGVVMVSGTHFLDRMLAWFGRPDEVEYWDDGRGGPEANALAFVRYRTARGPLEGRVRLSKTVALHSGFVLETERGIAVLPEGEQATIAFRPHGEPAVEATIRRPAPPRQARRARHYQLQLEDFAAACRTRREPRVPAAHGLDSLRLIESFYACRRPLDVDWDSPDLGARKAS
jgi:predicted dehydrogenase